MYISIIRCFYKLNLNLSSSLHHVKHGFTNHGGSVDDLDAHGSHGLHLGLGGALSSGDDGASMTHSTAGRSSTTSDEADDGLVGVAVLLQPFSGVFFGSTTDFADHDDTLGFGIVGETLQAVDEVGAVERIATNTDDGGLAEAVGGGLVDGFVGEGAGTRDNTDLTLLVDVAGHDTDLALTGLDDTGTVGTDQARLGLALHDVLHAEHIVLRNTFGDTDDQGNFSSDSLENGTSGTGRRDVNDGSVGIGSFLSLCVISRCNIATSATEEKMGMPK